LKKILERVRKTIIKSFEEKQELNTKELEEFKEVFKARLQLRWSKGKITEKDKFSESDIFEYPLEVVYLLYCYPIQLIAIIQRKEAIMEYWDFFLEEYPELTFQNNLEEYYELLRKKYK